MCFSFKVSLATFIFSWSSCIYLLNKGLSDNHRKSVVFLMIFSSMQAVDAILWYTGIKRNRVNYLTTSVLIPLILSLQVASGGGGSIAGIELASPGRLCSPIGSGVPRTQRQSGSFNSVPFEKPSISESSLQMGSHARPACKKAMPKELRILFG